MAEERMLNDEILLGLIKANSGGGGGGTSDYEDLSNKPQIGGTTLTGNKSASDLGLVAAVEGKGLSTNDYTDADKAIVGGVTAALAGKQNALTAGANIKIDNDAISVNRWFVPAGKMVYTIITSDENYGQNVHIQRHTLGGSFIDDRTFLCEMYKTVNIDGLISIYNPYSSFRITLLENSDEQQAGYNYTVNPITTPTSNSFTFVMPQEENDNDLIIREELDAVSSAVSAIKDGQSIDSFADVETALAGKQATLTFDDTPTDGSNNPVKSNGIYDALALKQNATDNNLATTSKTVVGAVNELKSGLTNYELQNNINLEVPNRKNLAGNPYEVMLNSNGVFIVASVRTYIVPTSYGKITISVDDITKISDDIIRLGYCDDIPVKGGTGVRISNVETNTYTITPDTTYKYLVVSNLLDDQEGWQDIQIEIGDTATAYAPYTPSVESRIEAVESGVTNINTELNGKRIRYDGGTAWPGTSLEFTVSKGNDFAYHFVAIASTANDTTSQSGYLVIRNDGTVLIVDQIGSFTASYNGTTRVLTITLPSGGYWDYRLERVASRLG